MQQNGKECVFEREEGEKRLQQIILYCSIVFVLIFSLHKFQTLTRQF